MCKNGYKGVGPEILPDDVLRHIDYMAEKLSEREKSFPAGAKEDIMQELVIAVLDSRKCYDAARSKFYTFAQRVVKRKIGRILRDMKNRRLKDLFVPLTEKEETERGETVTEESDRSQLEEYIRVQRKESWCEDVMEKIRLLPEDMQKICEHLMMGEGQREICRKLGMARMTYYRRISVLRKELAVFHRKG